VSACRKTRNTPCLEPGGSDSCQSSTSMRRRLSGCRSPNSARTLRNCAVIFRIVNESSVRPCFSRTTSSSSSTVCGRSRVGMKSLRRTAETSRQRGKRNYARYYDQEGVRRYQGGFREPARRPSASSQATREVCVPNPHASIIANRRARRP
jgi:hypothetical protein